MALTLETAYDLAAGGSGQASAALQRVTIGAIRSAIDIYSEDPAVTGHAKRAALATAVLNNPAQYGRLFVYAVVVDPTIVANAPNVTDAQVVTAIKSAWNAVAGV